MQREPSAIIVGAGPNGIYAASRLLQAGFRVTVIEAGFYNKESELVSKDSYEFISPSKMPTGIHRVGGASSKWHGRYSLFNQEDFEKSWNGRRWNLDLSDLKPNYERILNFLDLNSINLVRESTESESPKRPTFPESWRLRHFYFCNPNRFIDEIVKLESESKFELIQGHLVENFFEVEDEVEVSMKSSHGHTNLRCDYLILSGGTIQTTKLVSVAQAFFQRNLDDIAAKDFGYLMEHIEGPIGHLIIPRSDPVFEHLILNTNNRLRKSNKNVGRGIELIYDSRGKKIAITNQFEFRVDCFQLSKFYQKVKNEQVIIYKIPYWLLYRLTWLMWKLGKLARKILLKEKIIIWIKSEEIPFRKSRLTIKNNSISYSHSISRKTESLNLHLISEFKKQIYVTYGRHLRLRKEIETGVLPEDLLINFHPSGTLSMGPEKEGFLVNWDQSLHFSSKVFVTNASVFPTSSNSNPTTTALALTDRVCDHVIKISSNGSGR